MALEITVGVNEYINHGDNAVIRSLDQGTILAWCLPYNFPGDAQLLNKGNGTNRYRNFGIKSNATANMRFDIARATTDLTVISDSNPMVQNSWNFVGATWNTAGANADQKLWYGLIGTPVTVAASYNLQRVGSGVVNHPTSGNMVAGNFTSGGTTLVFDGEIAFIAMWSRVLDVNEMITQQRMPHVTDDCVFMVHYGFNLLGTQIDISGQLNNGTIVGTLAVTDHAPYLPYTPLFDQSGPGIGGTPVLGDHVPLSPFGLIDDFQSQSPTPPVPPAVAAGIQSKVGVAISTSVSL